MKKKKVSSKRCPSTLVLFGFVVFFAFSSSIRLSLLLNEKTEKTNYSTPTKSNNLQVLKTDRIMLPNNKDWDTSPVVVEDFKLIFFTVPKVACTTWKQLFRRIRGEKNWKYQTLKVPHNPATNSLVYLNQFNVSFVERVMQDPTWTKAIFVREPKLRFLSAFLDKAVSHQGLFVRDKCCARTNELRRQCRDTPSCQKCVYDAAQNLTNFFALIATCHDPHWEAISSRIDEKYWRYINYVGKMETIDRDGTRLLKRLGNAWETYGKSGWGKDGKSSMFEQNNQTRQKHSTSASSKVWQWYTPEIERMVEKHFAKDYDLFQYEKMTLTKIYNDNFVKANDLIWNDKDWDLAPVVVERYKLIFFTIPRIGANTWKRAFRRMEGHDDWKDITATLPHDPQQNGLKYLYHYSLEEASVMMTSDQWTRAIFVRNPKDRFLSVYNEYKNNIPQLKALCCPTSGDCHHAMKSFERFLHLMKDCHASHWNPQSDRMDAKYWSRINFVGNLESAQQDSERLLKQIGAWEDIGQSGWGISGNDAIFTPTGNEYNSVWSAMADYSTTVDQLVEEYYDKDYKNDLLKFPKTPNVLLVKQK